MSDKFMGVGEEGNRRSVGLAHELVQELTQRILKGTIAPGDKLPSENACVREWGVSRTVVREAISKLQAAGLVETRHGIGTFALEPRPRHGLRLEWATRIEVRDMLELRLGLESQAAALAARRRTNAHLEQLAAALEEYQRLSRAGDRCVEADRCFHLTIAQAAGNQYFSTILQSLGETLIPRRRIAASERGNEDLEQLATLADLEHRAILRAIHNQDADAARAAMWTHLTNSRERLAPESG